MFHLNQHVPKTSILLQNTARAPQIFYPTQTDAIKLSTGARLKLTCGDKYINKNFKKSKKWKNLVLQCNNKDMVNAQGERVHIRELECEDFPSSSVRKNTRKQCYNNSTLFNIGFQLHKASFLNIIRVCFNERQQDSMYTWYDSSMLVTGHQSRVRRPYFVHDGLYRFPVDWVYSRKYQRKRFAEILNSEELAEKYIRDDTLHFLVRGHLSPKADFVYGAEQSATFHYINVAPQWQIFNAGNWEQVERSIREEIKNESKRYILSFLWSHAPVL